MQNSFFVCLFVCLLLNFFFLDNNSYRFCYLFKLCDK